MKIANFQMVHSESFRKNYKFSLAENLISEAAPRWRGFAIRAFFQPVFVTPIAEQKRVIQKNRDAQGHTAVSCMVFVLLTLP